MKAYRQWFAGTSGFAGICAVLFLTIPESESSARNEVRGRVTYNGHPVTRAVAAFTPLDGQGDYPSGALDDSGCCAIEAFWLRPGQTRGRYRMYLLPFRGEPKDPGFPARYIDPHTSGLVISVGTEPAYFSVDLKD